MELTREQQAILDGSQGEVYAKIMKTLVMYGETFGATKMVPVTSTYGHIVTSFGVIVIKGVFDLMDELIAAGVTSKQKFSADPRPVDKNVPSNLLQDIVFKVMYGPQKRYEEQLKRLACSETTLSPAPATSRRSATGPTRETYSPGQNPAR